MTLQACRMQELEVHGAFRQHFTESLGLKSVCGRVRIPAGSSREGNPQSCEGDTQKPQGDGGVSNVDCSEESHRAWEDTQAAESRVLGSRLPAGSPLLHHSPVPTRGAGAVGADVSSARFQSWFFLILPCHSACLLSGGCTTVYWKDVIFFLMHPFLSFSNKQSFSSWPWRRF